MAKNKSKRPMEHVEIDDHPFDFQWLSSGLFDELILDNAGETLCPKVRRTAIEAYMAALRKCPQVSDNEGEDNS